MGVVLVVGDLREEVEGGGGGIIEWDPIARVCWWWWCIIMSATINHYVKGKGRKEGRRIW